MEKNTILVPLSIVIAGAVIAVAVYFINKAPTAVPATSPDGAAIVVRPVDSTDHLLGNPNAKIKLIEYSDMECPHCKTYHETLHGIMQQYGANGDVAWVFRAFPIAELHSKAPKEAQAAECVAALNGNEAFWKFVDKVFEVTPSDNGLDLAVLPDIAVQAAGVDRQKFVDCLDKGTYADKVNASVAEGLKAGIRGTPHTFIAVSGQFLPLEGAQPFTSIRSAIDTVLEQLSQPASPAASSTSAH
jgi:protein-disulfide isomerase